MQNLAEKLPVTYYIKGEVYRKFELPIDIKYEDCNGFQRVSTTNNDIKTLLIAHLHDISTEQMNILSTMKPLNEKLLVGFPIAVNIELDTFQQRRLKMIALDIN